MRVLVCGSRQITGMRHSRAIADRLLQLPRGWVLIHGEARGADRFAAWLAGHCGAKEAFGFPAEWLKHGLRAGPIRNQRMLDEGKPDLVLAFHTDPKLGRGTADMVRRARAAGVPVEVHILAEVAA